MHKEIIVKVKSVYGNDLIYPVCNDAITFASFRGTKTLSVNDLERIKKLGYTVKYT
jgi:hypothetical protein